MVTSVDPPPTPLLGISHREKQGFYCSSFCLQIICSWTWLQGQQEASFGSPSSGRALWYISSSETPLSVSEPDVHGRILCSVRRLLTQTLFTLSLFATCYELLATGLHLGAIYAFCSSCLPFIPGCPPLEVSVHRSLRRVSVLSRDFFVELYMVNFLKFRGEEKIQLYTIISSDITSHVFHITGS